MKKLVLAIILFPVAPLHTGIREDRVLEFTPWVMNTIKHLEKFSSDAYQDTPRQRSIGYGHYVGDKTPAHCSRVMAEKWLREDVRKARAAVRRRVAIPLTQNESDALVSFVYNRGIGGFERSAVLRRLNRGDKVGAMLELMTNVKSNGHVRETLVRRRKFEAEKFIETP